MGSFLRIPESYIRTGQKIDLFEIEGEMQKVDLLAMDPAEQWIKRARDVELIKDRLDASVARLRRLDAKRSEAIESGTEEEIDAAHEAYQEHARKHYDLQDDGFRAQLQALSEYPGIDAEKLKKATPVQIVGAFMILRHYNDPSLVGSSLSGQMMAEMFERSSLASPTNSSGATETAKK